MLRVSYLLVFPARVFYCAVIPAQMLVRIGNSSKGLGPIELEDKITRFDKVNFASLDGAGSLVIIRFRLACGQRFVGIERVAQIIVIERGRGALFARAVAAIRIGSVKACGLRIDHVWRALAAPTDFRDRLLLGQLVRR